MTTTLSIITDAYRESNVTGIDEVLTAGQKAEALRLLNAVVSSVYGFEVGEQLKDWPVGTVDFKDGIPGWSALRWQCPLANTRLIINVDQPQDIWFPNRPNDGARIGMINVLGNAATYPITLHGNGRNILGANEQIVNDDDARLFMYRADLANWVLINPIPDTDAAFPFPVDFDSAFITMLAMRINPRYGRALAAETLKWMERSISQLRARYKQRVVVPADLAVLIGSIQAYDRYYGGYGIINGGFGGLGLIG